MCYMGQGCALPDLPAMKAPDRFIVVVGKWPKVRVFGIYNTLAGAELDAKGKGKVIRLEPTMVPSVKIIHEGD